MKRTWLGAVAALMALGATAVQAQDTKAPLKLIATVPGNEAFQSLEASRCPLVKK